MTIYAQLNEENVVVATVETSGAVPGIVTNTHDVLGYTWNGTNFTAPVAPDIFIISVGAFYDRFGTYKIPILASDDAVVQAMVKDAQVRKHIDLRRSDLPMMLDVLIAKGFAIDKTTILETPAAANELP